MLCCFSDCSFFIGLSIHSFWDTSQYDITSDHEKHVHDTGIVMMVLMPLKVLLLTTPCVFFSYEENKSLFG